MGALLSRPIGTAAAVVTACLLAPLASALDVQIKDLHASTSAVRTTVEVRDIVPDRFRKVIDGGSVLHLRLQVELWESRPVWDRLVYPAITRVFRLARGSGGEVTITDGVTPSNPYPAPSNTLPVAVDLGDRGRVAAAEKYYAHIIATVGTLAERQADEAGDAVFGRESETNGLGSLGRLVFRAALKIGDYMQSVSAEAKSRRVSGSDLLKTAP